MTTKQDKPPTGAVSAEVGWRREPPDRPGWWLVEQAVTKQIHALYFYETDLLHTALYDTRWWAGPIEPPLPDDSHNIQSAAGRDNNEPNETDGHSTK